MHLWSGSFFHNRWWHLLHTAQWEHGWYNIEARFSSHITHVLDFNAWRCLAFRNFFSKVNKNWGTEIVVHMNIFPNLKNPKPILMQLVSIWYVYWILLSTSHDNRLVDSNAKIQFTYVQYLPDTILVSSQCLPHNS